MKKTLVIGASENLERYSNKAIRALRENGHEVLAIGLKNGQVLDVPFGPEFEKFESVDTVTLYIGPQHQPGYYSYVLKTIRPKRILFNPGTENPEFQALAKEEGIEVEEACTLVLLSIGRY